MEKQIIVVGSLSPDKECQDRVRVLSGGYMSVTPSNRLQRPSKTRCYAIKQCRMEPAKQSKVNTATRVLVERHYNNV